jgi:hypothetical protein
VAVGYDPTAVGVAIASVGLDAQGVTDPQELNKIKLRIKPKNVFIFLPLSCFSLYITIITPKKIQLTASPHLSPLP